MSINCSCVVELLEKVSKLRKNEVTIDSENFTIVTPSDPHAWAKLFAEYFVCGAHCTVTKCSSQSDDMLWYVRHSAMTMSVYSQISGKPSIVEVYRRQSKKQPCPGDRSVDWQETVYLNLILQQVEYVLTCAVCTKTSPQNLQILRKIQQRVFACPSRRRMDSKGESEEMTYPNIYFPIDGFEEVFGDIVVRDGECICVELIARDRRANKESAIFLGSIRYEVLKQVYDTRASHGWHFAQKLMTASRRLEFVRMRGPHGKGYAEMAVSRVVGVGFETPNTEELAFEDFEVEAAEQYRRRRMSDTNLSASNRYYSKRSTSVDPVRKSQSEADCATAYPEVEASSIDDELEENVFSKLWGMRGFGQAWHWLREKRRAASTPLNSYLTYVTLPWQSIIEDLLETPRRPILTFDLAQPTADR